MNLKQLECFFAVADELHFGRAASHLHLSQAAVSEAVAGLERSLGAPLFTRTTRRVSLTSFGEKFLQEVRPAYSSLQAVYRDAQVGRRDRVDLVLAHTPELGHVVFPRLLVRASDGGAAGADLGFTPRLMHTHEQLTSVAEGSVDVGLCWEPAVSPPLVRTVLARCPFVAILRLGDPLLSKAALHLSDLDGRRLLVIPRADNRFIESKMESALVLAGMTTSCLDEVERYDELAIHVASRSGVGLHPATVALTNSVPGLAFREIEDSGLDIAISVVTRGGATERMRELIDSLGHVALAAIEDAMRAIAEQPGRPGST